MTPAEKRNTPKDLPLEEQLKQRDWPKAPQGRILGDYDNSPYVHEGRVFTRALRMHQFLSEPIPPGETAITSLVTGENGKIYGATSGKRSHLFYYDPAAAGDGVVDLGVLPAVTDTRRCLVALGDRVFAAASKMEKPGTSGPVFVHETKIDYSDEFRAFRGETREFVIPVKNECVVALCVDRARNVLYGVSSETGTFFRCDATSGKVTKFGPVSKDIAFSKCLVIDSNGNVYGTHSLGMLFRFNPEKEKLEDLGIEIPTVAGRAFYNQLDSALLNPRSGLIYGAGTADGVLFSFDPLTLKFRTIGKPVSEPRVRAMALAHDGRLFGIAGCEDGMGRLFVMDENTHELRDLGILFAATEVWRRGFEFDAACVGLDGEIYFGESEWESSLFIYFPRPAFYGG